MHQFFEKENIQYKQLKKKCGYAVHREWFELFAGKLKDGKGKFRAGKYAWEAFDSGVLPCVSGNKAMLQYRQKIIENYLVVIENGEAVFECHSDGWPDFSGMEAIVLPESRSWSMIFSHEGTSYFAQPET